MLVRRKAQKVQAPSSEPFAIVVAIPESPIRPGSVGGEDVVLLYWGLIEAVATDCLTVLSMSQLSWKSLRGRIQNRLFQHHFPDFQGNLWRYCLCASTSCSKSRQCIHVWFGVEPWRICRKRRSRWGTNRRFVWMCTANRKNSGVLSVFRWSMGVQLGVLPLLIGFVHIVGRCLYLDLSCAAVSQWLSLSSSYSVCPEPAFSSL